MLDICNDDDQTTTTTQTTRILREANLSKILRAFGSSAKEKKEETRETAARRWILPRMLSRRTNRTGDKNSATAKSASPL